jgi:hypothetical protein
MPDRDLAMKCRRRWSARLYKDASVKMSTNVQSLSTGLLGSKSFIAYRFAGPAPNPCICICRQRSERGAPGGPQA